MEKERGTNLRKSSASLVYNKISAVLDINDTSIISISNIRESSYMFINHIKKYHQIICSFSMFTISKPSLGERPPPRGCLEAGVAQHGQSTQISRGLWWSETSVNWELLGSSRKWMEMTWKWHGNGPGNSEHGFLKWIVCWHMDDGWWIMENRTTSWERM
jgi:hypothetical protein